MKSKNRQNSQYISSTIETPLGAVFATAGENAAGYDLRGIWFVGQKYFPPGADALTETPDNPVFVALRAWLADYFAGMKPDASPPLALEGTDFQQAVWKILLKIPYGKTTTYGAIASELAASGKKASAQAVGGAVGHNPISLIVPCHRVVGADGSLTGYAGGLEKKRALLKLEGAIGLLPEIPHQPGLSFFR